MSNPKSSDASDLFDALPYAGTDSPKYGDQATATIAKSDSCSSKSGIGTTGIVIIVIVVILLIVGGIFLIKKCSGSDDCNDDIPCASGNVGSRESGHAESSRPAGALVEIETPVQWQGLQQIREPHVVAFTMTGCGHCVNMKPALESAGRKSRVTIYQLNFNGEPWKQDVVKNLGIQGFPEIIKFENGTKKTFQGSRDESSLIQFAESG